VKLKKCNTSAYMKMPPSLYPSSSTGEGGVGVIFIFRCACPGHGGSLKKVYNKTDVRFNTYNQIPRSALSSFTVHASLSPFWAWVSMRSGWIRQLKILSCNFCYQGILLNSVWNVALLGGWPGAGTA